MTLHIPTEEEACLELFSFVSMIFKSLLQTGTDFTLKLYTYLKSLCQPSPLLHQSGRKLI